MTDREKKSGRWKYKNLNIENQKSFLDEKTSFIVFEGLLIGEK